MLLLRIVALGVVIAAGSYALNAYLAWANRTVAGFRELRVAFGGMPRLFFVGDPQKHYTEKGRRHLRLMLISAFLFVACGAFIAFALPGAM